MWDYLHLQGTITDTFPCLANHLSSACACACLSPIVPAAPGGRNLRAQGAAPRGPPPAAALPLQRSDAARCDQARGAGSEVTGCEVTGCRRRSHWQATGGAQVQSRDSSRRAVLACMFFKDMLECKIMAKYGRFAEATHHAGMHPRGGRRRQRGAAAAARTGLAMDRRSRSAASCVICKSRAATGCKGGSSNAELPAPRPETR